MGLRQAKTGFLALVWRWFGALRSASLVIGVRWWAGGRSGDGLTGGGGQCPVPGAIEQDGGMEQAMRWETSWQVGPQLGEASDITTGGEIGVGSGDGGGFALTEDGGGGGLVDVVCSG